MYANTTNIILCLNGDRNRTEIFFLTWICLRSIPKICPTPRLLRWWHYERNRYHITILTFLYRLNSVATNTDPCIDVYACSVDTLTFFHLPGARKLKGFDLWAAKSLNTGLTRPNDFWDFRPPSQCDDHPFTWNIVVIKREFTLLKSIYKYTRHDNRDKSQIFDI